MGVSIKGTLYCEMIGILLFLSPLISIKGDMDDLYPCTAHRHILNSAKFQIQFKQASFTIIKMTKVGGDGGCIFADTMTERGYFSREETPVKLVVWTEHQRASRPDYRTCTTGQSCYQILKRDLASVLP